jgi:hypothetical protein
LELNRKRTSQSQKTKCSSDSDTCIMLARTRIAASHLGRQLSSKSVRPYQIAVLKGDGIGPEVVDEATKVLDAGS